MGCCNPVCVFGVARSCLILGVTVDSDLGESSAYHLLDFNDHVHSIKIVFYLMVGDMVRKKQILKVYCGAKVRNQIRAIKFMHHIQSCRALWVSIRQAPPITAKESGQSSCYCHPKGDSSRENDPYSITPF